MARAYMIAVSPTGALWELEEKVSDLMKAGWSPAGAISFYNGEVFQPMRREMIDVSGMEGGYRLEPR